MGVSVLAPVENFVATPLSIIAIHSKLYKQLKGILYGHINIRNSSTVETAFYQYQTEPSFTLLSFPLHEVHSSDQSHERVYIA